MNPVYSQGRELLEASVADELVALDVEGGNCFGFNDVATEIWKLLKRPSTADELVDQLVARYEVSREDCAKDLMPLLEQLHRAGLVKRS